MHANVVQAAISYQVSFTDLRGMVSPNLHLGKEHSALTIATVPKLRLRFIAKL